MEKDTIHSSQKTTVMMPGNPIGFTHILLIALCTIFITVSFGPKLAQQTQVWKYHQILQ